jgi:DivIVA domain-containing protein
MTTPPSPDEIRRATFRVGFRGFDTAEVTEFLERLAAVVEDLAQQRDRLASRLGEFAGRDLKAEFESVGREVASVLEAARVAADTMRERSSADAARWRSEAKAEADALVKDARADAEAMRTDAWSAGTQLLEQVKAEVERLSVAAQRDSLAVLGESEREAHRLTSAGRREAEELVRNARMEAEKVSAQAKADHDEIINSAHRQAESAQERTRALEQRRDELMTELESVRSALSSFETELEDRRQGLGLTEAPELPRQVVIADERGGEPHIETWEEGHTVRVIRPSPPESAEPATDPDADTADTETADTDTPHDAGDDLETDADELVAEVARLRERDSAEEHREMEDDAATAESIEAEPEDIIPAAPEAEPASTPPPSDEVFELFRRLRVPAAPEEPSTADEASPSEEAAVESPAKPDEEPIVSPPVDGGDGDAFETRERLLIPITNSALRAIKRVLTDAQNEALDKIRQSEGQWSPEPELLGAGLRDELESLVADATEAGREAATELGVGAGPPAEPDPGHLDSVSTELSQALATALASAGAGVRERSAAASRVFRGWRTDEAERRVRWVAMASYHGALASALEAHDRPWRWVTAGRPCPQCRDAATSGGSLPPAHRDCVCTIEPLEF